jgi:hypothetical protein
MTEPSTRTEDPAEPTSVAAFDVAPELADLDGDPISEKSVRDEAA